MTKTTAIIMNDGPPAIPGNAPRPSSGVRTGCGGPIIAGDLSLKALLKKIGKGPKLARDLTQSEAEAAFAAILNGTAPPEQVGAFLIAMRLKGESADELKGMALALRARTRFIQHDFPLLLELAPAHDGKNKMPVLSPLVAKIVASAGVPVVITGAEGIPAKMGLTPRAVLRELGVLTDLDAAGVAQALKETGFAYYDTSRFCPLLESLKPVRVNLGLRTPLNSVEKIINPAGATHLMTGVYHGPYLESVAEACRLLEYKNALCVQAAEASTDLPLKKRVLYRRVAEGKISEQLEIDPAAFNLKRDANPEFVGTPSAQDNAQLLRDAVKSPGGMVFDAAIYSAGVCLWFTGLAASIADGIAQAREIAAAGDVIF